MISFGKRLPYLQRRSDAVHIKNPTDPTKAQDCASEHEMRRRLLQEFKSVNFCMTQENLDRLQRDLQTEAIDLERPPRAALLNGLLEKLTEVSGDCLRGQETVRKLPTKACQVRCNRAFCSSTPANAHSF